MLGKMRNKMKPTISLVVICFVIAFCLAYVNSLTQDKIVERITLKAEEQRKQVLPEADSFKKIENWQGKDASGYIREVYAAYAGQKLIGYVLSAAPKGYGGEIQVTVGIASNQTISGVRIGDNKETPGLGSKASEGSFINQYLNKSVKNVFKVVKIKPSADNEIQAISGATITSKAVTAAVQSSAELVKILIKDGGGL